MAALSAILVVPAVVLGITDGDTLRVRAYPWLPGHSIETSVRVRGIDTGELGGHADCRHEAELGAAAKSLATVEFMGRIVALIDVQEDKYGGRVVATVARQADGADWAALMLGAGLAHPYDGRTAAPSWCVPD